VSLQVQRARKGVGLHGRIAAVVSCLFLSVFNLVHAGTRAGTDVGSVGVTGTDSYNSAPRNLLI